MEINRSNYEIWFIDWRDGNLNNLQVEQLTLFLVENPDLKEEFDELDSLSLNPSEKPFPFKEQLKRSTADISDSQFEYLCVAYLENDLSADQCTELKESIENDPIKKNTFTLIQKTRLAPVEVSFKHKKKLIKLSPVQRIIRMSVIGLSAAAAIALLITNYLLVPGSLSKETVRTSQNIVENPNSQPAVNKLTPVKISENNINIPRPNTGKQIAKVQKIAVVFPLPDSSLIERNDSLYLIAENRRAVVDVNRIPVFARIDFDTKIVNTLIAINSSVDIPYYDEERSNIGRFVTKFLREKIMKEPSAKNSPLKGYEIAEAGVSGLNKLLGWEMALVEKNDENGDLKSVYFNSKILKFNAPVKKSQPMP
jgi:hypothetical protein